MHIASTSFYTRVYLSATNYSWNFNHQLASHSSCVGKSPANCARYCKRNSLLAAFSTYKSGSTLAWPSWNDACKHIRFYFLTVLYWSIESSTTILLSDHITVPGHSTAHLAWSSVMAVLRTSTKVKIWARSRSKNRWVCTCKHQSWRSWFDYLDDLWASLCKYMLRWWNTFQTINDNQAVMDFQEYRIIRV